MSFEDSSTGGPGLNASLYEVCEYRDGVHYTESGMSPEEFAVHDDLVRQATRDEDGRLYIWIPDALLDPEGVV